MEDKKFEGRSVIVLYDEERERELKEFKEAADCLTIRVNQRIGVLESVSQERTEKKIKRLQKARRVIDKILVA